MPFAKSPEPLGGASLYFAAPLFPALAIYFTVTLDAKALLPSMIATATGRSFRARGCLH